MTGRLELLDMDLIELDGLRVGKVPAGMRDIEGTNVPVPRDLSLQSFDGIDALVLWAWRQRFDGIRLIVGRPLLWRDRVRGQWHNCFGPCVSAVEAEAATAWGDALRATGPRAESPAYPVSGSDGDAFLFPLPGGKFGASMLMRSRDGGLDVEIGIGWTMQISRAEVRVSPQETEYA